MNIGGIITSDVANGPGLRTSVFISGCPIHCKGCHNEKLWDYEYGVPLTDELTQEILDGIDHEGIAGLTILGGEPLSFENIEGTAKLIYDFRKRFGSSKTIWLYTGYYIDDLYEHYVADYFDLLYDACENVDVIVDGPYIEEEKDITLLYRGSKNQRIIDMEKTLENDYEPVLLDIDKYGISK